ncbi:hypothetical protein ACQU0X_25640 [Pseudovibrio ascidiaceicola]|uniref:hypothetical protein n=1 Tax=Pseudovibrio ascidiaceicola TaxID=285279 RepID=UPI003D36090F
MQYFVDANGWIWCLSPDGETNHPSRIQTTFSEACGCMTVEIINDEVDGESEITDEYVLHDSLSDLAQLLEGNATKPQSSVQSVSP